MPITCIQALANIVLNLFNIHVQMRFIQKNKTAAILLLLVVLMIALAFWVSEHIIQQIDDKITGDNK